MSITAKDGAREPRIATATATILVQVNYLNRQIGITVTPRDNTKNSYSSYSSPGILLK